MITKEQTILLSKYEDKILDLIENQLRNDENTLTQSDLQGVITALVMSIYRL
jgi:hypothetical protein